MNHADHVNLIKGGVAKPGGRWADLGSGEGAFTLALAELLGPGARIVAVDKDRRALRALDGRFETVVADFTRPLDLRDLDGVTKRFNPGGGGRGGDDRRSVMIRRWMRRHRGRREQQAERQSQVF